ncbi:iron-siderophore ABC transporter substrate-binding protein [Rhodococcus cerastii]|uniref:Iron-siderophore ABC transporter substrate-binding protein n=1 Tax=Rhodococcus cerastii TaxID=908616 RepID=A0ABU4CVG6_9NOCA|nr:MULTISPECIES: iron-siderophore ABC transporter substrate-binding protein [Rhodococcus]MDV6301446.1 iron-siderophore ABC transporter substrate-binding protein [Rhodococcus cerastii]MDV8055167.1 iron-siderophore ABC transporter substrate-binding protein [Rhodococcus sp. IEGM 1343]
MGAVASVCLAAALALVGCSDSESQDDASTIVRTTTNIAGAGVVGNNRDTAGLCPALAPLDPTGIEGDTRPVGHAEGISVLPADPQRIVVLDAAGLDASCAVGIWERVVGAATIDPDFRGDGDQPLYLGTGLASVPSVGPVGSPDIDAIAALDPDLILGAESLGSTMYDELTAIAPTVFTATGQGWKDTFLQSAAALGRGQAAFEALASFSADAERVGREIDATQTQASVVRFAADSIEVDGPNSFAGQILDEVGVGRPQSQRDATFSVESDNLTPVEGDIVYVRFAGPDGESFGREVMDSDAWHALGSVTDGRVFAVDDTVWSGSGVVAARAVLDDLSASLNAYVS